MNESSKIGSTTETKNKTGPEISMQAKVAVATIDTLLWQSKFQCEMKRWITKETMIRSILNCICLESVLKASFLVQLLLAS